MPNASVVYRGTVVLLTVRLHFSSEYKEKMNGMISKEILTTPKQSDCIARLRDCNCSK